MANKSFIILASSVLLFLVGSTLSAPPTPNEPENNQNDLTLVLARLNHLEAKVVRLETELGDEKEKNRLQEMEISNLKQLSAHFVPKMAKKNKEVGADGRAVLYPRSCREIAGNGQSIDGIYLVESTTTRIGAVFCEFISGSPPVETQIGLVDIKTSSVRFWVQRSSSYASSNTVVPWTRIVSSTGGGMSTSTGVFTAPKAGAYHFQVSIYCQNEVYIYFRVNGAREARGRCWDNDLISIPSSLRLSKGDTVDVFLESGTIVDSTNYYNQFTGWLDEEDLVF